jgi:hypothetical protein
MMTSHIEVSVIITSSGRCQRYMTTTTAEVNDAIDKDDDGMVAM